MDNAKSYNLIADAWDANRRGRGLDPILIEFEKYLPDHALILDVGCGTGFPIDCYLTKQGHTVIGIDPAEKMIAKAKSLGLPNASFYQTDLLNYQSDVMFDAVVAFDSLFHIEHDKQKEIYPIIGSMLKPGGLFLFTHGLEDGSVVGDMFGQKFYSAALDKESLLQCLKEAGFEIIWFYEHYKEKITGDRDLLALVKKIK